MNADMRVAGVDLGPDQVALAVEVFRMLADHTRVRLLWALLDDELSVGQLATVVGKPAGGVSQHLATLRMARLVRTRHQGNQIFYRMESARVRQLVQDALFHADQVGVGVGVGGQRRGDPGLTELSATAFEPVTSPR